MFGRFRHILPAVEWILGVATVWTDAGYLPHVGPVPLRFRAPAPPVSEQVTAPAPPPPMPIFLPPPPMPPAPKEQTRAPAVKPATNAPPLELNAREPITDPSTATMPEGAVSPQMLIKFFSTPAVANTNTVSGTVGAPVDFTPPTVASPSPTAPPSPQGASPTRP
jgi:hypothetical protein